MTSAASVGMIGLGLMGNALAARLIEAGIAVSGFDIDPAKGEALRAMGGAVASSVTQLAAQSRSIVIAVYNGEQVQSVFDELAQNEHPALPLVICTTTCAPREIADIAERARRAGLPLVEAPISGTSADLRQGSATALVAGEVTAVEAADEIFDILCPRRIHVGKIGNASRTKLAINLILQNNRAALAEGIVFAESLGLDAAVFLAVARQSAAYAKVMDSKGDKMRARDFTPQSHIAQTLKDAELILAEASRHDLMLPMTATQTALLRTAIRLEGPDSDSAAIIEAIRPPAQRRGAQ